MTDETHPPTTREGQERKEGQEERRKGQEEREEGQKRRGQEERLEGQEERREGQEKREGGEGTEGQEIPCQETHHPSGSHHELVVQTKLVSSAFYQQQRAELVPAPVKLVHVLP